MYFVVVYIFKKISIAHCVFILRLAACIGFALRLAIASQFTLLLLYACICMHTLTCLNKNVCMHVDFEVQVQQLFYRDCDWSGDGKGGYI